ncbi:hypothetical protein F2Q70_00009087 [Brassica cretica]|uniref:Leucine-rich repeat-containing N-terminal plant-type domain-containing protein n=1 Tax=Brassica cretica TaxID=69181 RepID=A0A8S9LS50_BRACR|nr:hypothetical protein F2Q70_00009087 [Brassica cretica]
MVGCGFGVSTHLLQTDEATPAVCFSSVIVPLFLFLSFDLRSSGVLCFGGMFVPLSSRFLAFSSNTLVEDVSFYGSWSVNLMWATTLADVAGGVRFQGLFSVHLFCILNRSDVTAFATTARHLCRPETRNVLLEFKKVFEIRRSSSKLCNINGRIVGSYPKTESWGNNSDCCYWGGVTCDAKSKDVIKLDLSCSCLHGRSTSCFPSLSPIIVYSPPSTVSSSCGYFFSYFINSDNTSIIPLLMVYPSLPPHPPPPLTSSSPPLVVLCQGEALIDRGRVAPGEFVGPKGRGFDPPPQICPSVWPGNWISNSHSNKWAASRRGVSPLGVEIPPGCVELLEKKSCYVALYYSSCYCYISSTSYLPSLLPIIVSSPPSTVSSSCGYFFSYFMNSDNTSIIPLLMVYPFLPPHPPPSLTSSSLPLVDFCHGEALLLFFLTLEMINIVKFLCIKFSILFI